MSCHAWYNSNFAIVDGMKDSHVHSPPPRNKDGKTKKDHHASGVMFCEATGMTGVRTSNAPWSKASVQTRYRSLSVAARCAHLSRVTHPVCYLFLRS